MEVKELLAGTVVHAYGIPVELAEHVKVLTFTSNWALIEAAKRDHALTIIGGCAASSPSDGSKAE